VDKLEKHQQPITHKGLTVITKCPQPVVWLVGNSSVAMAAGSGCSLLGEKQELVRLQQYAYPLFIHSEVCLLTLKLVR
jgi:hypothetical protein